jgi:hypothetical protein
MADRNAETRKRRRLLYREIVLREREEQDWWVNREVVEQDLKMNTDDLLDAAEVLVEDGEVSYGSSDYITLRLSHRGPSIAPQGPLD